MHSSASRKREVLVAPSLEATGELLQLLLREDGKDSCSLEQFDDLSQVQAGRDLQAQARRKLLPEPDCARDAVARRLEGWNPSLALQQESDCTTRPNAVNGI